MRREMVSRSKTSTTETTTRDCDSLRLQGVPASEMEMRVNLESKNAQLRPLGGARRSCLLAPVHEATFVPSRGWRWHKLNSIIWNFDIHYLNSTRQVSMMIACPP